MVGKARKIETGKNDKVVQLHPSAQSPQQDDLKDLRELLLRDDRAALDEIRKHLATLQERVGSDPALTEALHPVLLDALTSVQAERGPELRRLLAPLVVASIRAEVRNSREELVNALYPLTGKLVAASMRDALAKLTDSLNERVENASNPRILAARIRSRLTGKPISATLLRGTERGTITRAIVLERQSGSVVAQWSNTETGGSDADMVGGLIAALSSFASQTYAGRNSDLRSVELEGHHLVLRHSPSLMLALDVDGELGAGQQAQIDRLFLDLVTQAEADLGAVDDDHMGRLAVAAAASGQTEKKRSKVPFILGVPVFLGLAYWGYGAFERYTFQQQVETVQALVAAEEALVPYGVRVSSIEGQRAISVAGLVPPQFDVASFETDARAAIGEDTGLTLALQPILTGQENAQLEATVEQRLAALATAVSDNRRAAQAARATILEESKRAAEEARAARVAEAERLASIAAERDARISALLSRMNATATEQSDTTTEIRKRTIELEREIAGLSTTINAQSTEAAGTIATLSEALDKRGDDLSAALSAIATDTTQAVSQLRNEADNRSITIDAERERIEQALASLATTNQQNASAAEATATALSAEIAALKTMLAQERAARLSLQQSLIAQHTITFESGTRFAEPAQARQTLDTIATQLLQIDGTVIILGHGDSTGSAATIDRSALARAEFVEAELVARGVPTTILSARSMADRAPISPLRGDGSPNRRVTFEVGRTE